MHYEELQLADTPFKKHMSDYRYSNSRIANFFIKKNTSSITHSGKYPKIYRRTFNKNIGSGKQIFSQYMNTDGNEIVPLQHNSLNSIDTSHFTLSDR